MERLWSHFYRSEGQNAASEKRRERERYLIVFEHIPAARCVPCREWCPRCLEWKWQFNPWNSHEVKSIERWSQVSGTSKFDGFKRNGWKIQAGKNSECPAAEDKLFVHWKNIQTDDRFPRLKEGLQNLDFNRFRLRPCFAGLKSKQEQLNWYQNALQLIVITQIYKNIKVYQSWRECSGTLFPQLRVEFGLMMAVKRPLACTKPKETMELMEKHDETCQNN